jgi:DNA polymerase (family 10)
MQNQELANIFYEIAAFLEMEGVQFKPRAYEKAARSIELLEEGIAELYRKGGTKALEEIPSVGVSIAEKIEEFFKTGKIKYYESLKKKYPAAISEISKIEGIGPKMAFKLYKKLKVKNIAGLEKAAKSGKISQLEGFGGKSEENILKGIAFLRQSAGRFILGFTLPEIREIERKIRSLKEVKLAAVAGSVRRWKETIGDLDILVVSKNPEQVMEFFVSMPEVINVYAHGATKSAVKLKSGIDADIRVVPPESFGAALNYFTGSKEHNIALRELAMKKGYKLNEYGLFKIQKSPKHSKLATGQAKIKNQNDNSKFKIQETKIAGRTEEEIYQKLGLEYIEPELRENQGEIEAALQQAQGKSPGLPVLIGYGDIKGDLQIQTSWSDGASPIREMALEAKKLGYEYIAITDHTKSLAMAGGLDEKKLLKQMAEIDRLNKTFGGKPKILKGAEVNILKDGRLDLKDAALAKLDVCGAAVHSHFNMSRKDMTERIQKAMSNPNVDILFHPTGRLINQRPAYELDIEAVLQHAQKTGTVVEINAHPDRLDIKDEHIRMAVELGVKLAINTDSHATGHLHYMGLGIAQARRGWAKRGDIINTFSLGKILQLLK